MGTTKQGQQKRSTAKKQARAEPDKAEAATSDGVQVFRSAADRELAQRGPKIAEALARKATRGDVSSFKTLIMEAAKADSKKPKKKTGKRMAQQLAEEQPWEGPPERTGEEFEDWNGDPEAPSKENDSRS